jgi:hypothetical protein
LSESPLFKSTDDLVPAEPKIFPSAEKIALVRSDRDTVEWISIIRGRMPAVYKAERTLSPTRFRRPIQRYSLSQPITSHNIDSTGRYLLRSELVEMNAHVPAS